MQLPPPRPPSPLRLQASAAALPALTSAAAKLLSPLALTQLPQLLYPCSHSYCQTRRLLLTNCSLSLKTSCGELRCLGGTILQSMDATGSTGSPSMLGALRYTGCYAHPCLTSTYASAYPTDQEDLVPQMNKMTKPRQDPRHTTHDDTHAAAFTGHSKQWTWSRSPTTTARSLLFPHYT
jgi:hypothetical protein